MSIQKKIIDLLIELENIARTTKNYKLLDSCVKHYINLLKYSEQTEENSEKFKKIINDLETLIKNTNNKQRKQFS